MSDGPWWALRCCCGADASECWCPYHVDPLAPLHQQCSVWPMLTVPPLDLDAVSLDPLCPFNFAWDFNGLAGTYIATVAGIGHPDCSWGWYENMHSSNGLSIGVVLYNRSLSVTITQNVVNGFSMHYSGGDIAGEPPWNLADVGTIKVPFDWLAAGSLYTYYVNYCDQDAIAPVYVRFVTPRSPA